MPEVPGVSKAGKTEGPNEHLKNRQFCRIIRLLSPVTSGINPTQR